MLAWPCFACAENNDVGQIGGCAPGAPGAFRAKPSVRTLGTVRTARANRANRASWLGCTGCTGCTWPTLCSCNCACGSACREEALWSCRNIRHVKFRSFTLNNPRGRESWQLEMTAMAQEGLKRLKPSETANITPHFLSIKAVQFWAIAQLIDFAGKTQLLANVHLKATPSLDGVGISACQRRRSANVPCLVCSSPCLKRLTISEANKLVSVVYSLAHKLWTCFDRCPVKSRAFWYWQSTCQNDS